MFQPWVAQKLHLLTLLVLDIVVTESDHPGYVKHVLGGIYVFFTLLGHGCRVLGEGGVSHGLSYTTCLGGCSP